ncbi:hypothetical protein [Kribbella shirazensis]|uniref:Resolvase/invertase-type recombinase catalytic domain-containing protein n=1 Tax=Kribbella shirazensis TaxID=1105143 RepID=A0A7X5VBP5_9ACTN|nr:hypothetical protein [Kribbella shirazensis]NIK58239.1 hypothetical protein [Kribbella shirazensis]
MTAITADATADHGGQDHIVKAYGYLRKHFLMSDAELARARHLIVDSARRLSVQLIAIHVEDIETAPEAFHDLLAAVMRNEQRMIIAPDIHHFEVAGDASAVVERLESNGIKIVLGH